MSGRKNNLQSFQIITNGTMGVGSITSTVSHIGFLDNIGYQFNFTGSPVGTFAVQISADYAQDTEGNVTNPGNWAPLTFSTIPSTASGSPVYLDITQVSAPWIRAVYVGTSGSGTLNAFMTAKMI